MRYLLAGLFLSTATMSINGNDKPQVPVVKWQGVVEDLEKEKAKPESGILTKQKELSALWKEWRGKEAAPIVNFETHFVLVLTATNRGLSFVYWSIDADGALMHTSATSADKNGPRTIKGFGYALAVIPRETVKSYKGVKLPDPK